MRADITNLVNGRKYAAEFETADELHAWVALQEAKGFRNPWGKPERTVTTIDKVKPDERAEFVEEITVEVQEYNPETEEFETEYESRYVYRIPKEYEVVIDDTSPDRSAELFAALRQKRDELLRDTDFTQLSDAPLDSQEKASYRSYRQYLRGLPAQHNENTILNAKVKTYQEWLDGQL